ncbi:MAG: PAS domain S-box protein [Elusimicrobia bacterium]|nr:PAS domain S-box protein [Elusimicrobiota bacterium]
MNAETPNGGAGSRLSAGRADGVCPYRPAAAAFLRALGLATRAFSLYKPTHPVAQAALEESFKAFDELLRVSPGSENTLTMTDGRWLWDATPIADSTQSPETLLGLFGGAGGPLRLKFLGDVRCYELAVLCELAAHPPASSEPAALSDLLLQKGVKHLRVELETRAPVPESVPATAPAPDARPAARKRPSVNFSQLLRQLVESAVKDPEERTHLYADAVDMVKQSLDRHVAEATAALEEDKQRILAEQIRTERVLSTMADGKVIVDSTGRVLMMNPAAEAIAGQRLAELAGRHVSATVSGRDRVLAVSKDIAIDEGRDLSSEVDVVAEREVGDAMKRSLALIQDESGRVVGTYAVMPDVRKFEDAQRLKDEFVQRITHDLKAPLSSICSALELIERKAGPKLNAEEANFLDVCARNAAQLGEMISKILDFSKLEAGGLQVSPTPVDAEALIREVVESLAPWALRRGIGLEAKAGDQRRTVLADRPQSVQILANLISNSIKATPPGGRITIGAAAGGELHPGMAVFSVADTGCGIAPEDQERIFERFMQAPADGARREGVGLGLSIVRELIALHRGTVWVSSVLGKGATFSFTLPLADA